MRIKSLAYMAALAVCPVFADNVLHPGTPVLDRPTLTVLGIQLPISGDDNFNSTVAVRYRPSGTTAWIQGLPLFRVHPENTVLYTVMPQFAGSIFNLQPGTSYDIALDITDVNGHLSQTLTLTGTTRPVPSDPAPLRVVNVTDVPSLQAALSSAQAGDLIQIADGNYQGSFFGIHASGTPQNPIVIRGASEENTVLDGGNCVPCNVLEVYGSYVHVERLSLRNAERGLRFQGNGATANVVRYVHISNTSLGIGSQPNETDFYIADNILEGVLVWPHVYADDNGVYANNDGINMQGNGHVVAHNTISGYGDAMKTSQQGDRADDFYGNDILWTYDNGVELDASEGNTRCFRNRFTNTWDTLSVQPILGGPAYLFRNIVVNAADEQMKFHAVNTTPRQEPNGVLAYHNTFVSPKGDLYLCTSDASHHFWIENNIFVGPPTPANKAVMWCGGIDDGHFDYDGYWPDGPMSFNLAVPGGYAFSNWPNFAAVQAGGLETHGLILNGPIFANGLVGMPTYTNLLAPQDVTLAYGSPALDRGLVLPNINDGYTGAAPDLGALESGCPQPIYGPRPAGVDETNEPIGCASSSQPPAAPVPISISISPTAVTLAAGQSQTFTASVSGGTDTSVSWSIAPSGIGTFSNGVYTAPGAISASQTIGITATSNADPTKSATATITLQAPAPDPPPSGNVSVAISPGFTSLGAGQNLQYSATVTGSSNTAVHWTIAPPIGQISSSGLYTAPSSVASSQVVTVTARSLADVSASASTAVLLNPGAGIGITLSPSTVSLQGGASQTFTPTVTQTSNTAVTWSFAPPVGQLNNGTYTAPGHISAAQTIAITATSQADPTKSATATVNLIPAAPTITVSLTPPNVSLSSGGSQIFTATVTGSANAAVNWTLAPAGAGTLVNGVYTAPGAILNAQTVAITATSQADSTKSATATVNLVPTVSVSLTPQSVNLSAGQSQTFTASVAGSANTAVNWSISPSGIGAFSNGAYTAPATIAAVQTITITAVSQADATKSASATVSLQPAPPPPAPPVGNPAVSIAIGPPGVALYSGQTQQYTATVTGASNGAVTWSLSPALGSISQSGLYTAPARISTTQYVTITARSAANPNTSSSTYLVLNP